jgi:hypothetical protein
MKRLPKFKIKLAGVILVTAAFTVANFAHASTQSDEQSLLRGAVADVTPQQKYQSAIREAGGAFKESLRECDHAPGPGRRECAREAKAVYDADMAQAKLILQGRESIQAHTRG